MLTPPNHTDGGISAKIARLGFFAVFDFTNTSTISSFSRRANSISSASCASILSTCRSSSSVLLRAYRKYLITDLVPLLARIRPLPWRVKQDYVRFKIMELDQPIYLRGKKIGSLVRQLTVTARSPNRCSSSWGVWYITVYSDVCFENFTSVTSPH